MGIPACWRDRTPASRGALPMLVVALADALDSAIVRLVAREVPPLEIAFFRNLLGLAFMLPWLLRQGAIPSACFWRR